MNLSYEYNEYVVGYVVTDNDTGRSINFQFDKVFSNHQEPAYKLKWGCSGDDTYRNFSEQEREEITSFLKANQDTDALEKAFTKAMYENDYFKTRQSPILMCEIFDAAEEVE